MQGMNKVMLIGNLGSDPELRTSAAGKLWAKLSVATHSRRKVGDDWVSETEWHDVRVFDRTAENCQRFLSKGSPVFIEGRLETSSWTDDKEQKHWRTNVVASRVTFLSKDRASARGPQAATAAAATA